MLTILKLKNVLLEEKNVKFKYRPMKEFFFFIDKFNIKIIPSLDKTMNDQVDANIPSFV